MYAVNDTVMYGQSGICKITEICDRKFGRETLKYYVLRPVYGDNTVIYCPVDSDKVHIRKLLSADEVVALIREMPAQQGDWIENDNLRKEAQTEILRRGDHKELIALIKTLYRKRTETENSGRRFHRADAEAMAQAEKILYQEFAQVLDIAPDEVVPFIIGTIEKTAKQ
ncbi:MAG: CarD family transcriptional regulator [Candidatus Fimenecus sp.]